MDALPTANSLHEMNHTSKCAQRHTFIRFGLSPLEFPFERRSATGKGQDRRRRFSFPVLVFIIPPFSPTQSLCSSPSFPLPAFPNILSLPLYPPPPSAPPVSPAPPLLLPHFSHPLPAAPKNWAHFSAANIQTVPKNAREFLQTPSHPSPLPGARERCAGWGPPPNAAPRVTFPTQT